MGAGGVPAAARVDHEPTFGWDGEPPRDPDSAPALDLSWPIGARPGRPRSTAATAAGPAGRPTRRSATRRPAHRPGGDLPRRRRAETSAACGSSSPPRPTSAGDPGRLLVLEHGRHVRPFDPGRETDPPTLPRSPCSPTCASRRRRGDRCPACRTDHGIRYLGAGLATLAAVADHPAVHRRRAGGGGAQDVAVQRLGAGRRPPRRVRRQPLVHLLPALAARRPARPADPIGLNDLIAKVVAAAAARRLLRTVVPPDLHDQLGVDALLAGRTTGAAATWTLIGERLAFAAVMEVGLRSRQGRTLEQTRTAAIDVALDDPAPGRRSAATCLLTGPGQLMTLPDDALCWPTCAACWSGCGYRGAISHEWLRHLAGEPAAGQGSGADARPGCRPSRRGLPPRRSCWRPAKAGSEFDSPAVRGAGTRTGPPAASALRARRRSSTWRGCCRPRRGGGLIASAPPRTAPPSTG